MASNGINGAASPKAAAANQNGSARYQRGVALLRHCQSTLSAAEQRVKVLEGEALVDLPVGDNGRDHDEAGA